MRPVNQTRFGNPHGNCLSACVASLLELEVDDVPGFMVDAEVKNPDQMALWGAQPATVHGFPTTDWPRRLDKWLAPRGLYGLHLVGLAPAPAGLHVLFGGSPRDPSGATGHAVVARGNTVVHDPHPSRAGLAEARFGHLLLLPLDPAQRVSAEVSREIMSRQAVARLLDVHPDKIQGLVHRFGLPGKKVGSLWRFVRRDVLAWLEASRPKAPAAKAPDRVEQRSAAQ